MAILGFGVDIVGINRIRELREKYGDRFLKRIFTDLELKYCSDSKRRDEMLAARFAAKEATMKALDTGMYKGVHFRDIEIIGGTNTQPKVFLHDRAIGPCRACGATKVFLSLSHERDYAVAMVVVTD